MIGIMFVFDNESTFLYFVDDSLVHLAGIFHNLYLRLEETESDHYDGDSGWYVYIHHAAERPTLGVRTHGTSLYPGQGRDLRLDMKKVMFYFRGTFPVNNSIF